MKKKEERKKIISVSLGQFVDPQKKKNLNHPDISCLLLLLLHCLPRASYSVPFLKLMLPTIIL